MIERDRAQDAGTTAQRSEAGRYPFPVSRGPEESPYLTWIRNHSNYMTARGLLDYLRAAGVLLRGMVINFLIFVPYLLALAIGLAYSHHWLRSHPFYLTLGVLGFAFVWVLLFALSVPILRVVLHNRSVETGSESTVGQRDRYERSFGALLLAAGLIFALESLPWLLESFHDRLQLGSVTWPGTLAMASIGLAALSGASQLLALLSGVRKQVAMVLVGVLGLLVPVLVVVAVTDYLLYGLPPSFLWMISPLAVPVAGVIGLVITIVLGVRRRAFLPREVAAVSGLVVVSVGVAVGVVWLGSIAMDEAGAGNKELEQTLGMMKETAAQFERIENRKDLSPEVVTLLDAGAFANAQYQAGGALRLDELRQDSIRAARADSMRGGWYDVIAPLREAETDAKRAASYLESQMPLASLAYRLSRRPTTELDPLREELVRLARVGVIDEIAGQVGGHDGVATHLSDALLDHYLELELRKAPSETPDVKRDPRLAVRSRYGRLVADSVRERARDAMRWALTVSGDAGIAVLLDEEALLRAVEKKFDDVPGTAKRAQLAGTRELATLLTHQELLDLVFPSALARGLAPPTRSERARLLRAAVPRFPVGPDSTSAASAATARVLATLSTRLAAVREIPEESTSHRLALFHRTNAAFGADVASAAGPPTRNAEPTDDEIGRAAALQLAGHAVAEIDADYLRGLAFGESYEQPEGRLRALADSIEQDWASSARWKSFLALERVPLDSLAAVPFPPAVGGEIEPYEDRTDAERRAIRDRAPALWPDALRLRYLVAAKALRNDTQALAALARVQLIERALADASAGPDVHKQYDVVMDAFATNPFYLLGADEMAMVAVALYWRNDPLRTDELFAKLMFGVHGRLEQVALAKVKRRVTTQLMPPKVIFIVLLIVVIWLGCWITVDVNLTSIHGLYRDRLASAFLVGRDTKGDIGIEDDVALDEICRYEARSTAPYHIINVALNLQASTDIGIRDRQSDFFCFTPRYVGGHRTGYCRSETLEQVFPQLDVATAMAISAAAAAPNMGRGTSPLLVAFMTLINVRLGFWVPNPRRLEGFSFDEVFADELHEIESRRSQVYPHGPVRALGAAPDAQRTPTVAHGLVGIAFSGGGIRSASLNLGISQALHQAGVFDHCDYMSTVSGGGYVGSSISTLMRAREALRSESTGTVSIERTPALADGRLGEQVVTVTPQGAGEPPRTYRFTERAALGVTHGETIVAGRSLLRPRTMRGRSEVAGVVDVETSAEGASIVRVTGQAGVAPREYRYTRFDALNVKQGEIVAVGSNLIRRRDTQGSRFRWRVRPAALLREALSRLDETHDWVNLSDGGHIENLAGIELLRRRCKYIIIGDGEADPMLHFAGLARLMRYASIDLGIGIDLDLDALRLRASTEERDAGQVSAAHWTVGTITYPPRDGAGATETGYLLYLKSSFTGDEREVIREYRHRYPDFPHQSTADQAFDEDQFEAYRALGQHIAEGALETSRSVPGGEALSFAEFEAWIARLATLSVTTGPP